MHIGFKLLLYLLISCMLDLCETILPKLYKDQVKATWVNFK